MDAFLKTGKLARAPAKKLSNSKSGSSGTKVKKSQIIPWVEKYRPETVDDIVEQTDVVSVFRQCVQGADFPNLLLYGPPGSGKTSSILAAARQLFGDMYKDRILELNASDDRGIQVIREKVKIFSQLSASSVRPDGQSCPPFRIVILDEADAMTKAAQAALRRIMEVNAKTTRFCLVCNYVSRIIPPLTSRCTKFRFKPVGVENMLQRLEEICKMEGVNCKSETLATLVKCCNGDMRRAITTLQSCGRLKNVTEEITEHDVIELTEVIPEAVINNLIDVCAEYNFTKMEEMIDKFIQDAYSASHLFEQLNDFIMNDFRLSDEEKVTIFEKLALALWPCCSKVKNAMKFNLTKPDILFLDRMDQKSIQEVKSNRIVKPMEHHKQLNVCETRPAYRQGRKLTAIKVYTINDESRHLLVFGVPSINLMEQVERTFSKYGIVKSVKLVPNYPDAEEFTEVYHIHFLKLTSSRFAKKKLDATSFFGGLLHICYAPELETIEETREKLVTRRKEIHFKLQIIKSSKKKKIEVPE